MVYNDKNDLGCDTVRKSEAEIREIALSEAEKCLDSQLLFLKNVASVDCGTQNLAGNEKVVGFVEAELKKIEGIEIRRYNMPDYGIDIAAKLPCKNPTEKIILNAHTDTVFTPGTAENVPFRIENGRAYGLGVGDCKGGIIVAINAVRIAKENGLLPEDKEFVFMFNCDEEKGIEAGYRFFDSELPADRAYVFEGAGENMEILTGRKDRATFKIEVTGVRSHSGNAYLDGRSAVVEIAHRIKRLYENNDPENEIFFNFGAVTSADPLNVLSGHASVLADVRVASKAGMAKAKEIIERVMAEPPYLDGTVTTVKCLKEATRILEREEKNLKLYEEAKKAACLLGQGELKDKVSGGFGDVNYFSSKGLSAIDGLGPKAHDIHNTNESITVKSLTERTALFVAMLAMM